MIVIIAGGELDIPVREEYSCLVAVDGGLHYCDNMSLMPDFIIGDLDSVDHRLLEKKYSHIPRKIFNKDKDKTDLELVVEEFWGKDKIKVFAALGKRIDHSLYNLHLMCRYPGLEIETRYEISFAVSGEQKIPCFRGQTVSFIPVSGESKISSRGLKWELDDNAISISNLCLDNEIDISVQGSPVVCCLIKSGIIFT
jgi:thiamine pyrophosphokinase